MPGKRDLFLMHRLTAFACPCTTLFVLIAATVSAETLKVGSRARFATPSRAIQTAKDGDVIEIDAGVYPGDVATIQANRLTLRGVGQGRAKLAANGKHAGGKAIWVITGSNTIVENIEFSGCRVPDRNGAGIRPEGKNLAVRNCRFYDCENGILGGSGKILIERCEFAHCGPVANPATHSLYISQKRNGLYVVNNTMVYDHRHTNAFFVRVEKTDDDFVPVIRNNLCIGKVPLTNSAWVDAGGNLLLRTVGEAGLADPAKYDYHLKADSPCIGKGVVAGKLGDFDLTPTHQYVHPCRSERRPTKNSLDVGAFQFEADSE